MSEDEKALLVNQLHLAYPVSAWFWFHNYTPLYPIFLRKRLGVPAPLPEGTLLTLETVIDSWREKYPDLPGAELLLKIHSHTRTNDPLWYAHNKAKPQHDVVHTSNSELDLCIDVRYTMRETYVTREVHERCNLWEQEVELEEEDLEEARLLAFTRSVGVAITFLREKLAEVIADDPDSGNCTDPDDEPTYIDTLPEEDYAGSDDGFDGLTDTHDLDSTLRELLEAYVERYQDEDEDDEEEEND